MAAAVADTLAEVAPGERWTVIGHSMGGKVAMRMALTEPGLVDRLCVVDMAPVDYHGLTSFGRYVEGMRSVDLDGAAHPRRRRRRADRARVPDPVIRGFLLQNLRRESGPDGVRWRWQMNLRLLGDQLDVLSGWPAPGDQAVRRSGAVDRRRGIGLRSPRVRTGHARPVPCRPDDHRSSTPATGCMPSNPRSSPLCCRRFVDQRIP